MIHEINVNPATNLSFLWVCWYYRKIPITHHPFQKGDIEEPFYLVIHNAVQLLSSSDLMMLIGFQVMVLFSSRLVP